MHRIVKARVLDAYRVELTFADGTHGTVDLAGLAGHGVFASWDDYEEFRKVAIGDSGELVWPGGIDLCPDSLYMKVTGREPEAVFPALNRASPSAT